MALRSNLNVISFCTGGAGLDLAVELAFPGARSVCLVEREAFAVAHLVAAMEQGLMAPAPVWSDARTFNGRPWRGVVDLLIGGIPCQPHSLAGKRLAELDERDLWAPFRRAWVQSGAWAMLLENVGGMLSSGGAERVYRDLHRLGCEAEGGLFRASEVGATHERERLFILAVHDGRACGDGKSRELAHASHAGPQGRELRLAHGSLEREPAPRPASELRGALVVDASRVGRGEGRPQSELRRRRNPAPRPNGSMGDADGAREDAHASEGGSRGAARQSSGPMADTIGRGCDRRPDQPERGPQGRTAAELAGEGGVADANVVVVRGQSPAGQQLFLQRDDGLGLFPPGPGDARAWADIAERDPGRLPAISQSTLRGMAHGLAGRVDSLRLLGNGVVPLEGGYALRTLADRLATRGSTGAARLVRMMAT